MTTYFPQCKLHKTADLDPNKSYIFGQHPHGVIAYGTWLGFGTNALGFDTLFPGIDVRVSTLNINFRAPFLREYLLLLGVCSVSKQAILNILNSGKSVCIAIGGGSESLLAAPTRYDLILNRRKGFVRCAVQTGASLVPCISFGEPETYNTINQLRHSHPIRRFQRYLEKTLGFTIPIAFGRGLFLPWGLLPYPVPLNIVVGAPIEVEKYTGEENGGPAASDVSNASGSGGSRDAVFEAQVDKYHKQYVTALLDLFHQHKEKFAKHASDMQLLE
jgi:Diacylglycerol acyltransferase